MEPTEGYSFSSNPEMSAEHKRQKKLGQINTWAWEIIVKYHNEDNEAQADVPATSILDYAEGLRGEIHILDLITYYVIDYTTLKVSELTNETVQRFVIHDNGEAFSLSATPTLHNVTEQARLSLQMEEDEYVDIDIANVFHNLLEENRHDATNTQVDELLEIMEYARFGDEHVDVNGIEESFRRQYPGN